MVDDDAHVLTMLAYEIQLNDPRTESVVKKEDNRDSKTKDVLRTGGASTPDRNDSGTERPA